MYSNIIFRTGDEKFLVAEFLHLRENQLLKFEVASLENPNELVADNILAVHYADGGAQGVAGAVEILYCSQQCVKVFYGNYVYDNLDLDAVIEKIPVLEYFDSRGGLIPPYLFGGEIDFPEDWGYLYMGAMNHFFVRKIILDKTETFINTLMNNGGRSWQVFDAVAWFCMAQQNS
ncbi:MAG: hypothetical protein E7456_06335 [Ruminococcaceae bacterium]|nr:hypothetical protein [Oscillospiraceae bacterium]